MDLPELLARLAEPDARVLTLLGPGGVGKSALAHALLRHGAMLDAEDLRWIALEDLSDATQVPARIARELGAKVGGRGDGWAEAVAALRERGACSWPPPAGRRRATRCRPRIRPWRR